MGEFDQQSQQVGVQFNAARQTVEEAVFGNKYSITVEHQADSPERRAAREMYVSMVRISECTLKTWNYAVTVGDRDPNELLQLRHYMSAHSSHLEDQLLHYRAAAPSSTEEAGARIMHDRFVEAVNDILSLAARWAVESLQAPRDLLAEELWPEVEGAAQTMEMMREQFLLKVVRPWPPPKVS
ncbi:hypothetical protein ABT001_07835 [Streptomyces sp. NPDC002793]|uniref:hypothetical protein n=1 Tax=Streptomyces sp. NPDC002793 TaxID=3154432 RepID=UPI003327B341